MDGGGLISHLLDTCAFLDLLTERWERGVAYDQFQDARAPVLLSISVWEMARKLKKGKLDLPCDGSELLAFVQEVCTRFRIELLPLSPEVCWHAENLPDIHPDPFDRMILAQAYLAKCPVITCDQKFQGYPVKILWHRNPV